MDYPNDKGVTNRKHLDQVWEQTGVKPDTYKETDVPPAGQDLWVVFWELRHSIEGRIGWPDIYYYCLYNQIQLSLGEISIIQAMNSAANKWIAKKHRERLEKSKSKTPIKHSKKSR